MISTEENVIKDKKLIIIKDIKLWVKFFYIGIIDAFIR